MTRFREVRSAIMFSLSVATVFASTAWAGTYSGGMGTTINPYQIANTADWTELSGTSGDWSAEFVLTADIDFGGATLTPVGNAGTPFNGVFNGNWHVLRNAAIGSAGQNRVGLFGETGASARIQSLRLQNMSVTGYSSVGLMAGRNGGVVTDCHASGAVTGDSGNPTDNPFNIGGLVGYNLPASTLSYCYANVSVSVTPGNFGGAYIGGLVGVNDGDVLKCKAAGALSVPPGTSGGANVCGGLAGYNFWVIDESSASGAVNASQGDYLGGLIGYHAASLTSCSATGAVVNGRNYCGGLAGYSEEAITDCYARGAVSGADSIGGLLGRSNASVTNCYATGAVTGTTNVGGLIGSAGGGSAVSASYWDTQATGQATSAGGTGRTTDEMTYPYDVSTYVGWDFTTTWMEDTSSANGGYPLLKWQTPPSVQFETAASSGAESVSPVNLTVVLSQASSQTVTVDYRVTGGTSTGGVDRSCPPGTLVFAPGQTVASVVLTVFNDAVGETDETVVISLSNPINASLGSNTSHTYTILNEDPPSIQFDVAKSFGTEAASPATFKVTLTQDWHTTVSVNYRVTAGTSTGGGVDRTCLPGTLTFAPGEVEKTFQAIITDDDVAEGDESLVIGLNTPVNGMLGARKSHTFWILNDDGLGGPTVRFGEATASGAESVGTVPVTVALTKPMGAPVSVGYRVTGGTSTGGGVDRACPPGTLNFAAGDLVKTFNITVVEDAVDEFDETVIVSLENPVGVPVGSPASHTYTILDND